MRVFRDMDALPVFRAPIVTVGSFDGVHRGHLHLLRILKERAAVVANAASGPENAAEVSGSDDTVKFVPTGTAFEVKDSETIVVTFADHPRQVLDVSDELMQLTTLEEKILLISNAGVDNLVVMPFDEVVSRMSPEEFVRDFLVGRLGVTELVVGYNHRLGRGREGNAEVLRELGKKYGFRVYEATKFVPRGIGDRDGSCVDGEKISSTAIREAIKRGDLAAAERMLGRKL